MKESNIETHQRENNEESEQHLQENQKKFSQQCLKVMELLNQGKRLTVANAIGYGIMSLPRRILDCRENGLKIEDQWVKDTKGKRLYKEYFITITKRPTKIAVIEKAMKKMDKTKPIWVQPDLL
ncbi:MAG: hypothetical protein KAY50_11560 [Chitinophagaceae bacterium]|nr:hypothetical protein [Chitinophagaceae bacterium]